MPASDVSDSESQGRTAEKALAAFKKRQMKKPSVIYTAYEPTVGHGGSKKEKGLIFKCKT
jgi:hypothetical protein